MTAAYLTVSAATFGTELVAAPSAKYRRVVQAVYVNADTAMKVALISGYVNEIQSVYTGATGGTFTLTYSGQETAGIAFDANAATMVTRLEALSNVTDVTVTGVGTSGNPWLVTFVDPGGSDIALMTIDPASLTGAVTTIATDTPGVDAVDEIQSLYNGATGGNFTVLFDGQETGNLAYNISSGDLDTALQGLSNITAVTVTGAGTSGDKWIITFTDPGGQNVAEITTNDTNLTGGTPSSTIATTTPGVSNTDEIQSVYNNADSGTFTLTYSGQTTAAIAFDVSASGLDTALELLSNVSDVAVTGAGTSGSPWLVTFSNPAGAIDEMTATDTGLVEVNVVGEQTPGAGTEKIAFHVGVDGDVVLPFNPAGWFESGSAESLNVTTDTSGNAVILVTYDTVGGS